MGTEAELRADAEHLIASLHVYREDGRETLRDECKGDRYRAYLKNNVELLITRAGIGDDYYRFAAQAVIDNSRRISVITLTRNSSTKLQQYLNQVMKKATQ